MIERRSIKIKTLGNCDIVDITRQVFEEINNSGVSSGIVPLSLQVQQPEYPLSNMSQVQCPT